MAVVSGVTKNSFKISHPSSHSLTPFPADTTASEPGPLAFLLRNPYIASELGSHLYAIVRCQRPPSYKDGGNELTGFPFSLFLRSLFLFNAPLTSAGSLEDACTLVRMLNSPSLLQCMSLVVLGMYSYAPYS